MQPVKATTLLPLNCWSEIFSHTDCKTLNILSNVCKDFQEIIDNAPSSFTKMIPITLPLSVQTKAPAEQVRFALNALREFERNYDYFEERGLPKFETCNIWSSIIPTLFKSILLEKYLFMSKSISVLTFLMVSHPEEKIINFMNVKSFIDSEMGEINFKENERPIAPLLQTILNLNKIVSRYRPARQIASFITPNIAHSKGSAFNLVNDFFCFFEILNPKFDKCISGRLFLYPHVKELQNIFQNLGCMRQYFRNPCTFKEALLLFINEHKEQPYYENNLIDKLVQVIIENVHRLNEDELNEIRELLGLPSHFPKFAMK